jgi:hypothetical protein
LIKETIQEEVPLAALKDKSHDFWFNTKISEFLEKIFEKYANKKIREFLSQKKIIFFWFNTQNRQKSPKK